MKSGVMNPVELSQIVLGKNSRWDGVDEAKAEEYASSFEVHGQLQACLVRPIPNSEKVELIVGFTRYRAAEIYNERNPGSPMKLKVIQTACNAEEAFEKNVIENIMRSDLSPMDYAFAQRRAREEFGKSDKDIADFYHCSPSLVSRMKKLLSLPKKVQMQVHKRELSMDAACDLAGFDEAEREEVLRTPPWCASASASESPAPVDPLYEAGEPESNGSVKTEPVATRIKKKAREKAIERGGSKARSLAEVRGFFEGLLAPAGDDDEASDKCKELAKVMLKYIKGGISDRTMFKKIEELV